MSQNTNKQFVDVEVIPSSKKTQQKPTFGQTMTILLASIGVFYMLTGSAFQTPNPDNLQAQAGEINSQAQKEVKNPKLQEAEKKLEEAKKEVESLKVQAPLVDDRTELPKEQINKQEMIDTISSFINQYGNSEVAKYANVFVDECSKVDIHPYFCVAVAQADTSTGKQLTTAYNLGNVGNTDFCPTCNHLGSWEEGIRAIAQTLSNQYLRNATKVCHLSKGGWKSCPEGATINNGKFYASSNVNWDRNASWAFNWMLGKQWDNKQSIKLSNYV